MSALPLFLALAAATAATGMDSPDAEAASEQARLVFDTTRQPFAGTAIGIDGIDSERTVYGARMSVDLAPGRRTVWYTCPDEPAMEGGARLTFDFEPGEGYALVCRAGREAEIRPAGC
jgi:hypothetical protein